MRCDRPHSIHFVGLHCSTSHRYPVLKLSALLCVSHGQRESAIGRRDKTGTCWGLNGQTKKNYGKLIFHCRLCCYLSTREHRTHRSAGFDESTPSSKSFSAVDINHSSREKRESVCCLCQCKYLYASKSDNIRLSVVLCCRNFSLQKAFFHSFPPCRSSTVESLLWF